MDTAAALEREHASLDAAANDHHHGHRARQRHPRPWTSLESRPPASPRGLIDCPAHDLAHVADRLGVSVPTLRRHRHARRAPATLAWLYELRVNGDLGLIDRRWAGWHVVAHELVSPIGTRWAHGALYDADRTRQTMHYALDELRRLRAAPAQYLLGV